MPFRAATYNQPPAMERLGRIGWALVVTSLAANALGLGRILPAVAAGSSTGGVTLDGFGRLQPFGGLGLDTTGSPSWANWDIARAVVVRPDGSGGWMLDGFGAIHQFGTAPVAITPAYWGWDIARAMVFTSKDASGRPDGKQGYLLDGFGGLHQWGGAPPLSGWPYTANQDIWRGAEIHYNASGIPDGGWEMDRRGRVVAFGAAPPLTLNLPNAPIHQQLHLIGSGAGGYAVARWGIVQTFGSGVSPYWNGYTDAGGWDILRDIALVNPTNPASQSQPVSAAAMAAYQAAIHAGGGVVLDGLGGIHPFGGVSLDASRAPYWNRDIARALVIRPDGSGGWSLDGQGGIHAFGAAPTATTPAYWSWDIARAMVFTSRGADGMPDGRQGYLLDGFGGLHQWGGAPSLTGSPYTANQDIWRGAEIHYGAGGVPDGGWEMDRWGHVTAFGAAPALTVTGLPNAPIMQQLHSTGSGGYVLAKWGQVTTYGTGVSPYWSGYSDWGAWDILRDLVLINPSNQQPTSQPMSPAASTRLSGATTLNYTMGDPLIAQTHNLDCESAALRMALLAKGTDVSENWILGVMGADLRPAVVDQFGDIIRWGDPYQTFVGNVNGFEYNATGYGVYYPPIAMAGQRAGRWTVGQEGWSPHDLYVEVAAGNPAVVWVPVYGYWTSAVMRYWTAWDGRSIRYTLAEHAMTLIGVNAAASTVTLNDPNHGVVRTVAMSDFEAAFAKFNNMAVVVY